MMIKNVYIFLILTIAAGNLYGQVEEVTINNGDLEQIVFIDSTFQFFPILRDTTGTFPKQLEVVGKIVDITSGLSCGVSCGCGTIKVELKKPIQEYKSANVFIAIPCFNANAIDFLDKSIKIKLELLSLNNDDCFWNEAPMNNIDSKAFPFYIPLDLDEKLNIE